MSDNYQDLFKAIDNLEQQLAKAEGVIRLIGGMCGNPDAVDGCRNINKQVRNYFKDKKDK